MHMAGAPLLEDLRLRNRSVDDVAAYGDDSMNVWQTLEVISGNNLRRKYHYDGYSDAGNLLRLLTPCALHRETFGDKPTTSEQPKKFSAASEGGPRKTDQVELDATQVAKDVGDKKKQATAARESRRKGKEARSRAELKEKDELLRLTTECTDLVQCSFNIPRISARLERLMGTNVVRLTDRKYMRELREAIDDDHRVQLMNRIKDREIKELERERNLILEGKTDTIPEELSGDPIFVVNKRANIEILKRRAKLKTNREKNADRLLRQGQKWERERLRYKEEEVAKQQQQSKMNSEQRALENEYREEDARRGLDLLRINDAEWQDCELGLRDFLKSERDKMKERSWRVPTQFSSDPLDIRNVIRARKLFREEQRQKRLEELQREKKMQKRPKRSIKKLAKNVQKVVQAIHRLSHGLHQEERAASVATLYLGDDEASSIPSSAESRELRKHSQPDIKQQKLRLMEEQVEDDVSKGYLVTKEQYGNLRYADPMIDKLRDSPNIRDLYLVAEKIITYDVEEEQIPEEEFEIEDDDED